jgi:hypothetical protein
MDRFLRGLVDGLRARVKTRRKRALRKALAAMEQRKNQEATIWKSGKGGYHHDR